MQKYRYLIVFIIIIFLTNSLYAWLDPLKDKLDKANKEYKNKQYKTSSKIYSELQNKLKSKEKKAKVHFNLGNSYFKMKQYKKALQEYFKSYQNGNKDTRQKALNNLGNAYQMLGMDKKALEAYLQSLKENPSQALVRKNIERLFLKKNKKKKQKQNKKDKSNKNKKKKEEETKKEKQNKQELKQKQGNDKSKQSKKDISENKKIAEKIIKEAARKRINRKMKRSRFNYRVKYPY